MFQQCSLKSNEKKETICKYFLEVLIMRLILCVLVTVILVIGLTGISGCVEEKEINNQISNVTAPLENLGNLSNTKQTPTPTKKPTATPTKKPTATPLTQLVGDSATHVYHLQSCSWVHLISSAHLVYFNSAAQAEAAGYRPCGHCHPPT
jgi:Metal binding domain of Ada